MEDSMSPYYEPPSLVSSFQQAHAEPSSRQIDGIPGIGTARRVNGLESALRRISRWHRRRTAIRELLALSDHHLTDIGLDRSLVVSTVETIFETDDQPA